MPDITQHPSKKRITTTLRLTSEEHNAIDQVRVHLRPGVRESWNNCALRLISQALKDKH